jgi:hypothetical protein
MKTLFLDGRVRYYGKIDGRLAALDKVVRKLISAGKQLHFVIEGVRRIETN